MNDGQMNLMIKYFEKLLMKLNSLELLVEELQSDNQDLRYLLKLDDEHLSGGFYK